VAPIQVGSEELPLVIDEVPALAALAVHADGASRFDGAGELRVKESDRLAALVDGIAALGGEASTAGDGLLLGGGGCASGTAWAAGDHRIAMGLAVAALAARGRSTIEGFEASAVSFPGVAEVMAALGAHVEEMP
jgi:3-phosphoshikimate 1-carboxyvinyltransferase